MMSWIEVGGILAALILVTAVALTVWKKNLHKCAKEGEIKVLALCLSAALTCSAGVGFGFPGHPLGARIVHTRRVLPPVAGIAEGAGLALETGSRIDRGPRKAVGG